MAKQKKRRTISLEQKLSVLRDADKQVGNHISMVKQLELLASILNTSQKPSHHRKKCKSVWKVSRILFEAGSYKRTNQPSGSGTTELITLMVFAVPAVYKIFHQFLGNCEYSITI
jgi:hypothetical protein